jgi:hypothetical protein
MSLARRRIGLQPGDRVRMSAAWRDRVGFDACRIYRFGDGAVMRRGWTGEIEDFEDDGQAVVVHAAEDCGCSFERGQWCRRCENTGTARRRWIPIEDLEALCER